MRHSWVKFMTFLVVRESTRMKEQPTDVVRCISAVVWLLLVVGLILCFSKR